MRVGILTFHRAINHGAVLQAYATQELLRAMGHEAELIDYRNAAVEKYYDDMKFHLGVLLKKRKKRYVLSPILFGLQRGAFRRFKKRHLNISAQSYRQCDGGTRFGSLDDRYDLILVGSDQLWNLRITHGFDEWFWGNIPTGKAKKTRIASWAVCMNHTGMADGETARIGKYLENFDALSVREKNLAELIAPYTDKTVVQTLDPTLLLPAEKWKALCKDVRPKDYVAAYAIEFKDKRRIAEVARRLADREGLSVVLLRVYADTGSLADALHGCGPTEFLSYISGARFVVTSSFHGTAFSLIFEKQFFCVIDPAKGNVRVENLLRQTGMQSRRIGYDEDFGHMVPIDYGKCHIAERLKGDRQRSTDYLRGLLSGTN